MGLLDGPSCGFRAWSTVGEHYEVTRKPRNLDWSSVPEVPFAPMDSIPQDGRFMPSFVPKAQEALTSGTYFERGDVLVAKITPSFENGKQALITNLPTPFGYATTEVIPLRPRSDGQDRRLLFYYLLHPDVRSFVASRMEGSTGRQRVPDGVLLDLPFPEMKYDEQTKVADILSVVQQSARLEDALAATASRLKAAAMGELFTRGLRGEEQKETEIGPVPASWEVVSLGSLGRIGNGSTPKKTIPEYWTGGTFPWLTSAKVYDRLIVSADEHVSQVALAECHLPILEPGAVLVAITGQGKTLGNCAVLGIRATISQHLAYVKTNQRRANPWFIKGYLDTQYQYLRQIASGGGSTKGALTCGFLRELAVPLPRTRAEQDEIVAILDAIDQKIDLHRRRRALLDELFRSLLHKLMTGEIRVADLDLSALPTPSEASP